MDALVSPPLEVLGAETGNCLRVAVALEVLGLDYTPKLIDLGRADHRREKFLSVNPDGRVPVLIDRSRSDRPYVLTQSNAILLHLCEVRPGVLLPANAGPQRSVVLERFFYFVTDVIAPNGSAFYLRRRGQIGGAECLSQRSIEAIIAAERFVTAHSFMAGDQFSLADIAALTVIRASDDEIDWDGLRSLGTWFERVMARQDVQRGLAAFATGKR